MLWPSRWRSEIRSAISGLGLVIALAATPAIAAEDGKSVFGTYCVSCHGMDGRAKTSPGHYYRIPDWTTTDAAKKLKDDQIRTQIRTGKLLPNQSGMPAFKSLTDGQVDLLLGYVRKLSSVQGK